jgi:hypothetical protein
MAALILATSAAHLRGHAATLLTAVFGLAVAAVLVTWVVACVVATLLVLPFLVPYAPYLGARANPTAQQAGSTEERALSERQALAKNTNEIFVENPVVGVGVGALPTAMYHAYPDFRYHYSPAHVVLLVVAAEVGIFGALAYAVLMIAPWLLARWRRHHLTAEEIGLLGALLAVSVIGLFDYYTWSLTSGRIWFWLVLALWLVAYRRASEPAPNA